MADSGNYSREALVRDIINAISAADGKPIRLGDGEPEKAANRGYIGKATEEAIRLVNSLEKPRD